MRSQIIFSILFITRCYGRPSLSASGEWEDRLIFPFEMDDDLGITYHDRMILNRLSQTPIASDPSLDACLSLLGLNTDDDLIESSEELVWRTNEAVCEIEGVLLRNWDLAVVELNAFVIDDVERAAYIIFESLHDARGEEIEEYEAQHLQMIEEGDALVKQ
jgi:hypothetical protein